PAPAGQVQLPDIVAVVPMYAWINFTRRNFPLSGSRRREDAKSVVIHLLRLFAAICLLRAGPQDLPASRLLLRLALGCYLLFAWLLAIPAYGQGRAVLVALFDVLLLVVFVQVLLYLLARSARIPQTLIAMAGSGSLLGLLALPLVLWGQPSQAGEQVSGLLLYAWLLLLCWNLLVAGHILRHALSTSLGIGTGVALLYALFSMQLMAALFPYPVV
ncbi:MAG TPA: hypothetical protein VET88_05890, partial [Gammaproteobacteria bacterium]|nr:hypothetical protein [Gammaproteobacteria bacterium]